MPEPEYATTEDGRVMEIIPKPPLKRVGKNDMSDLFEVPRKDDNDMRVDHLFALPEPEDVSDLVDIDTSDITGYPASDKLREEDATPEDESPENKPHWSDADVARMRREWERETQGRNYSPAQQRPVRRYDTPPQLGGVR